MRLGLVDAQAFQQPPELLRAQAQYLFLSAGPLVPPAFQALVQQQEAICVPVQGLEPVCPPSAEQKQGVGKGIQLKAMLYDTDQPVDAAAQVGVPAGDVDMLNLRGVKHLISPRAGQAQQFGAAIRRDFHRPALTAQHEGRLALGCLFFQSKGQGAGNDGRKGRRTC